MTCASAPALRAKAPPFVYLAPLGCGEHGGDPESVKFFHRVGLNYVSCSPLPRLRLRPAGCPWQAVSTSFRLRVPVARLAAAQAAIEEKRAAKKK